MGTMQFWIFVRGLLFDLNNILSIVNKRKKVPSQYSMKKRLLSFINKVYKEDHKTNNMTLPLISGVMW